MVNIEEHIKNKRVFERFPARFPARFKNELEGFGRIVSVEDACAGGVRLSSKIPLNVHEDVSVEVKLPGDENPLDIQGKIVWARQITDSEEWEAGVKFHQISLVYISRLYESAIGRTATN